MKNEIKKVLFSRDDETLKGIVIVRDNKVEICGYGKNTKKELSTMYLAAINELKQKNEEEFADLSLQEVVNKLSSLEKLVEADTNLITNITYYANSDSDVNKFVVTYTDKEEEYNISDFEKEEDFYKVFKNKFVDICKQYDIKIDVDADLKNSKEKLEKLGLLSKKNNLTRADFDIEDNTDEDNIAEVVKENKIKNLVLNHKFISGVLFTSTIILIASGIKGCSKKKNDLNVNVTFPPIEDIISTDNSTIESDVSMFEEDIPTFEPIEYFKEISFEGEEDIFTYYDEPESDIIIAKNTFGNSYDVYDDYYGNVDNLHSIRYENVSNIGDYIQSDIQYNDRGMYIYYENLFSHSNIKDKAYVKYFSMMGNEIIKNAYQNNDYNKVNSYAKLSGLEVIKLIKENIPLHVYINGYEDYIYYSELSNEAKEIVLNIVNANNSVLNSDRYSYKEQSDLGIEATVPEINYNGYWYTKSDVFDVINEKVNEIYNVK